MGRVEVGKRYKCKNRNYYGDGKWEDRGFFTIVHREQSGLKDDSDSFDTRNYIGVSDDGKIVEFNFRGEDEWHEFGGNWWELDLAETYPPRWETLKRIEGKDE